MAATTSTPTTNDQTPGVFFNKVRVNKDTNTVTLYVTSIIKKSDDLDLTEELGFSFGIVNTDEPLVNGQLNLLDHETKKPIKADHPSVKKMQTMKAGTKLPGLVIDTDNPVINLKTGKPLRNLYWVRKA